MQYSFLQKTQKRTDRFLSLVMQCVLMHWILLFYISQTPRQAWWEWQRNPGPEVIKLFSCSTQLSMKFVLLINLKLLTILNSFLLNIAEHENFSANKYENANLSWHFHIYWQRKFHAQLSWAWKKFYNLGARWIRYGSDCINSRVYLFTFL